MDALGELQTKWNFLVPHLDERQRRLMAAAEASVLGYGGIALVAKASGLSRTTVHKALEELEAEPLAGGRVRQPGAGRKRVKDKDPGLLLALEHLIDPATRGDPMSPLRWTCKSTRQLALALTEQGHAISHTVVSELLQELGYSLQANAKTIEGKQHPDRDAQFQYINRQTKRQSKKPSDFRRCQEKRTRGHLQERRPRMAAERQAGTRSDS